MRSDKKRTFSLRAVLRVESDWWEARVREERRSSRSRMIRSFSRSFWRRRDASDSREETREAMAMEVILRARSSCWYGSVGITDRISSGRSKSTTEPVPCCDIPIHPVWLWLLAQSLNPPNFLFMYGYQMLWKGLLQFPPLYMLLLW